MIGKFNSLECLEQGSGLIPNVAPDAFAVAPEFDCTEELRVEILLIFHFQFFSQLNFLILLILIHFHLKRKRNYKSHK